MYFISAKEVEKAERTKFFFTHWGSPRIVISTGIFQCDDLDGFVIFNEEKSILGFITFVIKGSECEIISLDSLIENQGLGSRLIQIVEGVAKENGCQSMKVITTNDNLKALSFYQKRGYKITKVLPDAVKHARRMKPEIPLVAENGIPIRDEIIFEKTFRNNLI